MFGRISLGVLHRLLGVLYRMLGVLYRLLGAAPSTQQTSMQ